MKDPAGFWGRVRLGDLWVFSSWKQKGQGNEQPCSDFLEGGLIPRSSHRLRLSHVWFLGWPFLASKELARKTCSCHLRGCLRRWKFFVFCVGVTAAHHQSGLGQQSQSTPPCLPRLGTLQAAGGKNRRQQRGGVWCNWEVQGSLCCLLSWRVWWRHSVRKYLVLLVVLLAS